MCPTALQGSFWTALFFGYASAILGVSGRPLLLTECCTSTLRPLLPPQPVPLCAGYETSAQFVQEQGPGVFVQTLSNLWLLLLAFNPLMAFLALGVVPLEYDHIHTRRRFIPPTSNTSIHAGATFHVSPELFSLEPLTWLPPPLCGWLLFREQHDRPG